MFDEDIFFWYLVTKESGIAGGFAEKIEAAEKCENGFINLRILNDSKISRKVIVVENTYNNKNIDIDKLFEKGYSSKENNMQNHGLGLWNVRKILRKKDNLNLYTTKGELFSQQLEIY